MLGFISSQFKKQEQEPLWPDQSNNGRQLNCKAVSQRNECMASALT